MKKRAGLAAVALILWVVAHEVPWAGSHAEGAPTTTAYLVVYKPGPAWLEGKPLAEQPLKEHGRYLLSLYVKGSLKFAGPFSDNAGGAAVFDAADDEEAQAVVAADPAVTSGVFIAELHPWRLVDWARDVKK
jgi:uncharacterized protein